MRHRVKIVLIPAALSPGSIICAIRAELYSAASGRSESDVIFDGLDSYFHEPSFYSLLQKSMSSAETVFLTGFPGFIAGRLLRRLAKESGPFPIARAAGIPRTGTTRTASALHSRRADLVLILAVVRRHNRTQSRTVCQLIWKPRVHESTIVFHLAAVYDLAVDSRTGINRVNVDGTRNVNEFADRCLLCATIITCPLVMLPENVPAGFLRMSCSMKRVFATTTKRQSIWRKLKSRR